MEFDSIPKYELTEKMFRQLVRIDDCISHLSSVEYGEARLILRKTSHIHSINSSLAIEGNDLPLSKTIDIIDGKAVQGPFDEIIETKNAIEAYSQIGKFDVSSIDDFLRIHDVLTFGLIEKPGFREEGVGVFDGDRLIYKAPDYTQVPSLIKELFDWCSRTNCQTVIKSAVMHFYIESIHPFVDGNGRIGRLWQNAILQEYDPVFKMVSIESTIRKKQDQYYSVLEDCQSASSCESFIEFSNDVILSSLDGLMNIRNEKMTALLTSMGKNAMSAEEIMEALGVSNRSNFLKNYIRPAIESGIVVMTDPEHPRSRFQKYRKTIV
ncbi:MAG: Fic family protein [Candidatus Methanomethylophilaceae archaeon]|nr:Fic family protein [Candidatus Methanomethylophilaceae archaeon]